jgi:ABC-type lipoprotein release transport system permease subunit
VFLLAAPALEHFAFGVAPRDPAVIALALALFTLSAALASFVPARRALAIEPMQVLRSE